tara:strand:+ start:3686 stop:3937 length:252 start_codon:yes stop_codon:yes gene_type:complete
MNYDDMNQITKKFLLNEGETSIKEYVQSLMEIINSLTLTTQRDINRRKIANSHVKEIRRRCRRLEERIGLLEEQITILEETKE